VGGDAADDPHARSPVPKCDRHWTLVICNFLPHFVDNDMYGWVIVK